MAKSCSKFFTYFYYKQILQNDLSNHILNKLGSFYSDRLATVLEENLYNIAHSLVLLLKGTPVILAGDEIALQGRNEIESYMKWDNQFGCGFTDNQEIGSYFQNVTGCENNVLDATSTTGLR